MRLVKNRREEPSLAEKIFFVVVMFCVSVFLIGGYITLWTLDGPEWRGAAVFITAILGSIFVVCFGVYLFDVGTRWKYQRDDRMINDQFR